MKCMLIMNVTNVTSEKRKENETNLLKMAMRRRNVKKIEWTETPIVRAPSAAAAAAAAYRGRPLNWARRGLMRTKNEFKSVDLPIGPVPVNTTGSVTLLNGLGLGTDINQRVGREVVIKSIQIRGHSYVTATTGTDQVHRIIIFVDKQVNAAAPTTATLLGSGFGIYTMKSLENRKRFKILYDRCVQLNTSTEPGAQKTFEYFKKVHIPVTFNAGNTGLVGDIVTGGIFMCFVGENAGGPTAGGFTGVSRLRYIDS